MEKTPKHKELDEYTDYLDSIYSSRQALREECIKVGITHIRGVPLNGRHGINQLYTALIIRALKELDKKYPEDNSI